MNSSYLGAGDGARTFVSLDGFVVRRLRSLGLSRKGRQLRPGKSCDWTREYSEHPGLHRLCGRSLTCGNLLDGGRVTLGLTGRG
jgi:hypothetical protein